MRGVCVRAWARVCVCACACACARVCVCVCLCSCVRERGGEYERICENECALARKHRRMRVRAHVSTEILACFDACVHVWV
jgi:hypothetical protein